MTGGSRLSAGQLSGEFLILAAQPLVFHLLRAAPRAPGWLFRQLIPPAFAAGLAPAGDMRGVQPFPAQQCAPLARPGLVVLGQDSALYSAENARRFGLLPLT